MFSGISLGLVSGKTPKAATAPDVPGACAQGSYKKKTSWFTWPMQNTLSK